MSRSALVNDGVPAFLVLLVLLLAISLVAVIRLPRGPGLLTTTPMTSPAIPRPRTSGTHEPVPVRRKNAGRCAIRSPAQCHGPVRRAGSGRARHQPGARARHRRRAEGVRQPALGTGAEAAGAGGLVMLSLVLTYNERVPRRHSQLSQCEGTCIRQPIMT